MIPAQGGIRLLLLLPSGESLEAERGGVTTRAGLSRPSSRQLSRYTLAKKTIPTKCPACPRCKTCPKPQPCPEQTSCPSCPEATCPEPEPCPSCSACPGCPPQGLPRFLPEAVQAAFVDAHNAARAAEASPNGPLPPMTWNPVLAISAQLHADRCETLHSTRRLPHADNRYVGENMAFRSNGDDLTVAPWAVDAWMQQKAQYDYASNTCDGGPPHQCGHYTQVVWRDSVEVGCGIRNDCPGNFSRIIVCQYLPTGNMNMQHNRPH